MPFSISNPPSSGGSSGSFEDAAFTGDEADFFDSLLVLSDGSDRPIITSNFAQFEDTEGDAYLFLGGDVDSDGPQVATLGSDIWMEVGPGDRPQGDIGFLTNNISYIGWVKREGQQIALPGYRAPKGIFVNETIGFVPSSEATSLNLSSNIAQFSYSGTVAGSNRRVDLNNVEAFSVKNPAGPYVEIYTGLSSIYRMQTNLNFGLNSNGSTSGKLCFTDTNGNADGKRLETKTLSGGTLSVTNASVTANTCFYASCTSASNQGFLTFTPSAGSGYTITSSNASDASTYKILLIENGY